MESLPFFAPFSTADPSPLARTRDPRGDWYTETITRATVPLPKLSGLDVSHNRLTATGIDHEPGHLPAGLTKLNISSNPLGNASSLIRALSRLEHLSEFVAGRADFGDDSFPVNVLSEAHAPFPALSVLDVGETQVTRAAVEAALLPVAAKRKIEYELTTESPKPGTLRVVVGKQVIKEAWEIEAEQRAKARTRQLSTTQRIDEPSSTTTKPEIVKEACEIEAEQGLFTEGARRRARAATATRSASPPTKVHISSSSTASATALAKPVEKEAWEIEAEQGLLTAGGRRRARAAAAASALSVSTSHTPSPSSTPGTSPTPPASALANPQYYSSTAHILTLPPSSALPKASHMRSFSLAAKAIVPSSPSAQDLSLAIPTPTLPLAAVVHQPFSDSLKCLILTGRRMDPTFNLPSDTDGPFLPRLEELNLENCGLSDAVAVSKSQDVSGNDIATSRTNEAVLPLIARLFPSLKTLDLSYNSLTSASISTDALARIMYSRDAEDNGQPARAGLRHLRLRGNRLTDLDGFQGLAEAFKGNRVVSEWKVEELDVRDNEISRLPPEIGLLPMDVFLVDGNVYVLHRVSCMFDAADAESSFFFRFRVPARRVWEREGTKGLLSWLRGRIE